MKLGEWIDNNCISRKLFSDRLGVSKDTLYAWETGRSRPSYENLKKIMEFTNGGVGLDDFINQVPSRMENNRGQPHLLSF